MAQRDTEIMDWDMFVSEISRSFGSELGIMNAYAADVDSFNAQISKLLPEKSEPAKKAKKVIQASLVSLQVIGQVVTQGAGIVVAPATVCFNAVNMVIVGVQKAEKALENLALLMEVMMAFLSTLESSLDRSVADFTSPADRKTCDKVLRHFLHVLELVYNFSHGRHRLKKLSFAVKNMFTDQDEIKDALDKMERLIEYHTKTQINDILSTVSKEAQEIGKVSSGVALLVGSQERDDIRKALSLSSENNLGSMNEKIHHNLINTSVPGSGLWLVQADFCEEWMDTQKPSRPTLNIAEQRSTGKTYLTSRLVRHLLSLDNDGSQATAYFYLSESLDAIILNRALRSIAWQLVQADETFAQRISVARKQRLDLHSSDTVWRLILEHAKVTTITMFICLDGFLLDPALDSLSFLAKMYADVLALGPPSATPSRLRLYLSGQPMFFRQLSAASQIKGFGWMTLAKPPNRRNRADLALYIDRALLKEGWQEAHREEVKAAIVDWIGTEKLYTTLDSVLCTIKHEPDVEVIRATLAKAKSSETARRRPLEAKIQRLTADLEHSPSRISEVNTLLSWVIAIGGSHRPSLALMEQVIALKSNGNYVGRLKHRMPDYGKLLRCPNQPNNEWIGFWDDIDFEEYLDAMHFDKNGSKLAHTASPFLPSATTSGIAAQEIESVRSALKVLCKPDLYLRFGFDEFFDAKVGPKQRNRQQKTNSVRLDRNASHVEVVHTCLRAICDHPNDEACREVHHFAAKCLPRQLNSVDLDDADVEIKREIGTRLLRLFHDPDVMQAWWTPGRMEHEKLHKLCRAVRACWHDSSLADVVRNYGGEKGLALEILVDDKTAKVLVNAVLGYMGTANGAVADASRSADSS